MKIARGIVDGEERTLVVYPGSGEAAVLDRIAPTPDDAMRDRSALEQLGRLVMTAPHRPLDAVSLLAPLRGYNRDILCAGWNYWAHYAEGTGRREGQDPVERPGHPTFFTKGPGSVVGPYDEIVCDVSLSSQWDYEAELALVIGRAGRSIPVAEVLDHVAAYLVCNDVTARDVQRRHGGQWFKGKSLDRTAPLGPWLTTADEVPDPAALDISCELNGAILQSSPAAAMAWSVPELIAELSEGMMLNPGDVVLTGTPPGVGNAREPQVFLRAGDVLVTRVTSLGELRNEIVDRY